MPIGHNMDIVSMPKVPGCRTTFAKTQTIQAVDTISVLLRPIMQVSRKWAWPHKKMSENVKPKSNQSRYKFIALTNYDTF